MRHSSTLVYSLRATYPFLSEPKHYEVLILGEEISRFANGSLKALFLSELTFPRSRIAVDGLYAWPTRPADLQNGLLDASKGWSAELAREDLT